MPSDQLDKLNDAIMAHPTYAGPSTSLPVSSYRSPLPYSSQIPNYGSPVQTETTTLLVFPTEEKLISSLMKKVFAIVVIVVILGGYHLLFSAYVYRDVTIARASLWNEKENWRQQEQAWRKDAEAKREAERRREEQWHRDEEGRERLGLFWDNPTPESHCFASGTREYWSLLRNVVPYNYNWLTPCREMPAVINGELRTTDRCEIKFDGSGAVYGHWVVNDAECTPYWVDFKDNGCVAPGSQIHRYEAHLVNIPDGEYWKKICATTPYDFFGHHFDSPHSCMHWGKYGVYAIWEIEDSNC